MIRLDIPTRADRLASDGWCVSVKPVGRPVKTVLCEGYGRLHVHVIKVHVRWVKWPMRFGIDWNSQNLRSLAGSEPAIAKGVHRLHCVSGNGKAHWVRFPITPRPVTSGTKSIDPGSYATSK